MDLDLRDRVVLVTGGTRGIGKEIAAAFMREYANVIVCARGTTHIVESLRDIAQYPGFVPFIADVTNPDDVRKLFSVAIAQEKKLDILVNNVGGAEKFGNFFDLTDDDWIAAYRLNFLSMVYCCREAIPWLKKSDHPRIINIASLPAHQPGFFNPHYSAAKAAVENLSKHLSLILAKDNILVNTVCPSTIKGGGWERNARDRARSDGISAEEAEQRMEDEEKKKTPLGRIGTVHDVASLVLFLASPEADFITGESIDVDGGTRRSVR